MKKVLIYYPPNKLGMSDFEPTNYKEICERVKCELNGKFPNVGNKVWLQGITSAISTGYCEYEFGYEEIPEEEINKKYDCVLLPLANCFHAGWVKYMKQRTQHIKKIKIPVYVIACGVQADSYDDLSKLVEQIKEPATEFIQAVYNTGGEFALRGYFTAEFFEKLGFHNAVVTGCPSLFQMGRNLQISNKKVDKNEFKATLNGTFKLPIDKNDIDRSDFICQSTFGNLLYDNEYFKDNPYTLRRILRDIRRGDYSMVKAIADERIHLFADMQQWMSYFIDNNISFSFGSRIHGTIMPILSGVPSLLYSCDARTREMAEFFDIPYMIRNEGDIHRLYDLYYQIDYSVFNKKFSERFDAYEAFLKKCGLVDKINEENIFMSRASQLYREPDVINKNELKELKRYIQKRKVVFDLVNYYYNK